MINKTPLNIYLLDNSKSRVAGLLPVTTMDIYSLGGRYNPNGLYSEEIFGPPGSDFRQQNISYIDMRCYVMHPKIYQELVRLKGLYNGIITGNSYAIWDAEKNDFIRSDIIDGKTGYSFFMSHFHDIIYASNDSDIRQMRIDLLNKSHDKCMYRYLIVIPAGLRDIEVKDGSRVTEDDINNLYRKVLRASNTISVYNHNEDDPIYDTVRSTLQNNFNEIYNYIESILEGKKGFILSKWAARNLHGGTRNVITAMDPSAEKLGSQNAIKVTDTVMGLHQYLKGTSEVSIFNIKNGPMANIILNLPNPIYVVDKVTLKRKQIVPSSKTIETWGTESGIEETVDKFAKFDSREKPIYIDNDYAALIYRDKKYFKVFYDIDELPHNLNKANVKPLSWTEMFYISVYKQSKKVAAYITRYPITTLGSIYPSTIFLKTTVKSETLQLLDDDWKPTEKNDLALSMPIKGEKFVESMSPHISCISAMGADCHIH